MASFDAVVRFLMRGEVFTSAYNAFEWAIVGPSRSILTAFGAGVGGVGAGIGATFRAVKNWMFGPEETGDNLPSESSSSDSLGCSSGFNQVSEMGLGTAASCQSLSSSYYSAQDGDSQLYLLAPSVGNSQEDVAAGETAV